MKGDEGVAFSSAGSEEVEKGPTSNSITRSMLAKWVRRGQTAAEGMKN
jgi:hypothetical protein